MWSCGSGWAISSAARCFSKAGARQNIPREAVFEIYQEAYEPPLDELLDGLV